MIVFPGDTRGELGGSARARIRHGHLGDFPPQVDLSAKVAFGNVVRALSVVDDPQDRPSIRVARDLSDGGLVQSLTDTCLRFGTGGPFNLGGATSISGLGDSGVPFSES